jgi:Amt family ammonium transporter
VHGIGGIWGVLATGLWATTAVNPAGANGLFAGSASLLGAQLLAVGVVAAFAFGGTFGLLSLVNLVSPMRVSEHDERVGLDLTQHREAGYTLVD